jgi:hypothetical protein
VSIGAIVSRANSRIARSSSATKAREIAKIAAPSWFSASSAAIPIVPERVP